MKKTRFGYDSYRWLGVIFDASHDGYWWLWLAFAGGIIHLRLGKTAHKVDFNDELRGHGISYGFSFGSHGLHTHLRGLFRVYRFPWDLKFHRYEDRIETENGYEWVTVNNYEDRGTQATHARYKYYEDVEGRVLLREVDVYAYRYVDRWRGLPWTDLWGRRLARFRITHIADTDVLTGCLTDYSTKGRDYTYQMYSEDPLEYAFVNRDLRHSLGWDGLKKDKN